MWFDMAASRVFQSRKVTLGINVLSDTPPDTRYRNGMNGLMISTLSCGKLAANSSLSLSKMIQGKAPFAPDSGPLDGIVQPVESGWNGSWCRCV